MREERARSRRIERRTARIDGRIEAPPPFESRARNRAHRADPEARSNDPGQIRASYRRALQRRRVRPTNTAAQGHSRPSGARIEPARRRLAATAEPGRAARAQALESLAAVLAIALLGVIAAALSAG